MRYPGKGGKYVRSRYSSTYMFRRRRRGMAYCHEWWFYDTKQGNGTDGDMESSLLITQCHRIRRGAIGDRCSYRKLHRNAVGGHASCANYRTSKSDYPRTPGTERHDQVLSKAWAVGLMRLSVALGSLAFSPSTGHKCQWQSKAGSHSSEVAKRHNRALCVVSEL